MPATALAPSRRDAWLSGYVRWASARVFEMIGLPVYLIVTDGFRHCRDFNDLARQLPRVRARDLAIGPFQPPVNERDIPSFIEELRERMVGELDKLRELA